MSAKLLLALTACAVAPAAAEARFITFGSTLAATPTIAEAHPVDSVFWPWKSAGGEQIRVPARGSIYLVSVKGHVVKRGARNPENRIFLQTLAPRSRGRRKVRLTSGPFSMPIGGRASRITRFRPSNLCAQKGDAVGFNNVGGFMAGSYPQGAPFEVFGAVPGAATARFTKAGGTLNGKTVTPSVRTGAELLMQVVLATGKDAAGPCR